MALDCMKLELIGFFNFAFSVYNMKRKNQCILLKYGLFYVCVRSSRTNPINKIPQSSGASGPDGPLPS